MFPRLIPPSKVTPGNTSENLLNEIRKIVYSLYRAKDNNIMNSIHKINSVQITVKLLIHIG